MHGSQDSLARFRNKVLLGSILRSFQPSPLLFVAPSHLQIATHFKGRQEILGYEVMNEPWCGDHILHPELFLPAVAGAENLMPLYDRINDVIRQVRTLLRCCQTSGVSALFAICVALSSWSLFV